MRDVENSVIARGKSSERESAFAFCAADKELHERADAGGVQPFEAGHIQQQNRSGFFAQRCIESCNGFKREAAGERDGFYAGLRRYFAFRVSVL